MGYYPEFAHLLNGYLNTKDRNQSWLARELGVNPSTVSRWLSGERRPRTPETVARIADFLGIHSPSEQQILLTAAGYGYHPEKSMNVPTSQEREYPEANISGTDQTMNDDSYGLIASAQPLSISGKSPTQTSSPFMVPALPPQGVFGRDDMLRYMFDLLALKRDNASNMPPIALLGMGGIGKTTLAVTLGRSEIMSRLFPDGVLWTAVGLNPTIRNLLDDWGRVLGVNLLAEPNEEACRDRLRTFLYHRRALLIVDDVWEVAHGQSFMVAGPHCRTVFTTRESPIAYNLATRERTLRVDVLDPEAALGLLYRLVPEAVIADEQSTRSLCKQLEFLPLALTLAGRMLATEADVPSRMQRLVNELIEQRDARLQLLQAEGRLGLDSEQPVSLQAILGMSVERLSKSDQECFAMLSVFGGEPLTWEIKAAAHVWACSIEEAEAIISRFVQRGLVTRRGEDYWIHALLVDYASEMMEQM